MRHLPGWFLIAFLAMTLGCAKTTVVPKPVASYLEDGAQAMTQGDEYALHGCKTMALTSYLKAVEYFTLSDDQRSLATACNNIGTLYLKEEKPQEAIHYLEEARLLHRLTGSIQGELRAITNLAATHALKKELEKAGSLLDEANALAQTHGITWTPAQLGRANLLLKQGEAPKALAIIARIEANAVERPEALAAAIHYAAGSALFASKQHKEALGRFQKALALDTRQSAFGLMADDMKEIALCLRELNKPLEATWYLRRGLKLSALLGENPKRQTFLALLQEMSDQKSPVTDYLVNRWTKGDTFAAPCK